VKKKWIFAGRIAVASALLWGASCGDVSRAKDEEAKALMKKAGDLVSVRRYGDARKALEAAVEISPGAYEIQREYVKLLARAEPDSALSYVNTLLEKRSGSALPYLLRSQLESDQVAKEKWIDDALALEPASAWALIAKARLALEAGENGRAIELLEKAVSSPAAPAEGNLLLAEACGKAGNAEKASGVLRNLASSHPDEEVRSEASAELFFLLWENDREGAIAHADELLASSRDPFLLADVGATLAGVPDHMPGSVAFFERAMEKSDTLTLREMYPEASTAWLEERSMKNRGFFGESLGGVLLQLGRHEEAVGVLEKAREDLVDPTKELLFSLAQAYRKTGREDAAIDALLQLVAAQIDRAALSLLDTLYVARHGDRTGLSGRIEEARSTFSREAPGFTLAKDDGGTFSLGDLRGKVVFLAFWFPT
jgi:tetratricopeptide (TPR) repeat protein